MTSHSGMLTSLEQRVPSTKDKTSPYNSDSTINMYLLANAANWVTLSHLHWAHSGPWAHILEWIHLSFHSIRRYNRFYAEWSPALTVTSICLSVLSMLSSAPKKIKPPNDAEFVKRASGRGPKAFLWSYHDDKAWKSDIHLLYRSFFYWIIEFLCICEVRKTYLL
jgi:hypothetical protein